MNERADRPPLVSGVRRGSSLARAVILYLIAVAVPVLSLADSSRVRGSSSATPYLWLTALVLVGLWLVLLGVAVQLVRRTPSPARRVGLGLTAAVLLVLLAALDFASTELLDFALFWQF